MITAARREAVVAAPIVGPPRAAEIDSRTRASITRSHRAHTAASYLTQYPCHAGQGVLHHVFRQCEVLDSKDARQRGDHAPRFAPKQMVAGIYHMFSFMTGRTSTAPSTSKIGQPLESSTAWSRSRASISV
jgi:hypothetical protein